MHEGVEPRLAPPGTLTYAQNVRWERPGRIRKRVGATQKGATPGGATYGGSWVQGDLVAIDETVHRFHEDNANWWPVGNDTPIVPVGRYPLPFDETNAAGFLSVAVASGVVVTASSLNGTTRLIGTTAEGRVLWQASFTGDKARLLLVGSTLYCIAFSSSTLPATVVARTVQASLGTVGSPTTLFSSTTYSAFDIANLETTSSWLVATWDGAQIRLRIMSGTSQTAFNNVPVAVAILGGLAIAGSGANSDTIWVAWHNGTNLIGAGYKWDLSNLWTTGNTTLFAGGGGATGVPLGQPTILRVNATQALIAFTRISSPSALLSSFSVRTCLFDTAAVGTVSRTGDSWGWALTSKFMPATTSPALSSSTRARVWVASVANGLDLSSRSAILDLSVTGTSGPIDGTILALSYERDSVGGSDLIEVAVGSFLFQESYGQVQRSLAVTPLASSPRSLAELAVFTTRQASFAPRENTRTVQRLGPGEYVCGGGALVEVQSKPAGVTFRYLPLNGFPQFPFIAGAPIAGGALTGPQDYTYLALYEHLDDLGQRVRSSPSAAIVVATTGVNKQITIEGTVPSGTGRPGATLHLYRSWLGGPYHRVTPDFGAPLITSGAGAATTAGYVSFTDNMSDATASTKEELPYAVDALPNDPPSGARLVVQGDGRLFCACWDPHVVWVSKLWVPGEPAQFVDDDAFRIFFPEPIVALAYQDGALVGLGKHAVYLVSGDGPNDNGTNPFPEPRLLPTESGCVDWRSVVTSAIGTFFQSQSGIMLLPRGFGPPVPIGADVIDSLSGASGGEGGVVIGSAKSRQPNGAELVHFLMNQKILTYDTRAQAWSVDVFTSFAPLAIGTLNDRLVMTWASTGVDTVLWMNDQGVGSGGDYGSSGAVWVEMRLRFAELRPFGICGMGRLEKAVLALEGDLGTIQSNLVAQTTLDDGIDVDGQTETRTYPLGSPGGMTSGEGNSGLLYLGVVPARANGTSFGLELYDSKLSAGSVNAQSWDFFGFSLQVQAEEGLRDLPATAVQ
jgi:hypothetical protein